MVKNFLRFYLCENTFTLALFLQDIFTTYKILDDVIFSFSTQNRSFYCPLASITTIKKVLRTMMHYSSFALSECW